MEDVQASLDNRNLPVNLVGIKDIQHPVIIEDQDFNLKPLRIASVASLNMYVDLAKDVKGTHMSRFVEMLNEGEVVLSVANMSSWVDKMVTRLEATNGLICASFPFFVQKKAPVSQASSLLDYQVSLEANLNAKSINTKLTVVIPITSLCPCSKKISQYGAHNQRSHVTVTAFVASDINISQIIRLVEQQASSELYGTLKRPDEKYVTEKAYENPKFVEDLVRDIASELNQLSQISSFTVSSENFESIHNHSAFAQISIDKNKD